jgi:hypothetical protein
MCLASHRGLQVLPCYVVKWITRRNNHRPIIKPLKILTNVDPEKPRADNAKIAKWTKLKSRLMCITIKVMK